MKIYLKRKLLFLFVMFVFLITVNSIFAQNTIQVRLASIVPENSAWGQAINRLAADFRRITNGQVEVIVFHNGTAGNETEILRRMRANTLQAGVFSSMGMNSITPEVLAFSYPFLIRNEAEYNEVMRQLRPDLISRMERSGFVTLAWVHAGWIRIFSRTPVISPNDLRGMRLGSDSNQQEIFQAFRTMRYQVVPADVTELLTAFNFNRIDAAYSSPVFVASNQLFTSARYMSNINVSPFMGGILINRTTWQRIPERFRSQLLEVCRRLEREIESSVVSLENDAIIEMQRYGLTITDLTPAQLQVWYDDVALYENTLIGGNNPVFHREYYTRIKDILTEFRRRN